MNAFCKQLLKDVKKFGQETTIHGVFFLVSYKLHPFERFFWAIIVATAVISSITLCLSNWNRYLANPTVVSLQKDFRNWNNPFPAATGCLIHKTKDENVDEYIEKYYPIGQCIIGIPSSKWGVNHSHPSYDYYIGFVKAVANVSYHSLDLFKKYANDDTLNSVDMLDLAVKVYPGPIGTFFTFETNDQVKWVPIMTEKGICFTINSLFSKILAYRPEDKKIDSTKVPTLRCHYLNGLCYARFDSESNTPVMFYVYSYLDILHATASNGWPVNENQEIEINYRMQETSADINIRSLSPAQRRCRFEDEPISKDVSYYSAGICHMLCRYKKALKLCRCKPFFYHNLEGKVCDLRGMACLADHAEYLLKSPSELGCKCPQSCNIITYVAQAPKMTVWEYGYFDQRITFRWGLLPPTTKYHRNVLFGFEDLVVSFGGIVALFLGISFISIIETIFFVFKIIGRFVQLSKIWKVVQKN